MTQIIFDFLNVHIMYVASLSCLCPLRDGTTGIMMDSGDDVLHKVPIYDGYALPHGIRHLDLAGRDFTEYLRDFHRARVSFTTTAEREIGRDVKEKLCYIALDYDTELKSLRNVLTSRPMCSQTDTSSLSVLNVSVVRVFFKPSVIGKEASGRHEV